MSKNTGSFTPSSLALTPGNVTALSRPGGSRMRDVANQDVTSSTRASSATSSESVPASTAVRYSNSVLRYVYAEHETGLATAEDTESISAPSTSGISNATSRATSRASSISTAPDGLPAGLASPSSDTDPVSEDCPEIGEENVTQQSPHLEEGESYPQAQDLVFGETDPSVLSLRPSLTRMSLFSNGKQFVARLGNFGLRHYISVLADAIETEAPLSATKTRVRWTCVSSYIDNPTLNVCIVC